ncbi:MAG: glutamate mutase L, partial [Candidatus Cloacimonetes bacterium]|nr:glutamate mutase L [Candidatus Cloacimonadota bacterium]
ENKSLLQLQPDTVYLTTSSAGGGLQILVIGLTLFDSAGSGERAAFGAGGVILDTLAIDDKRSSLEQMQVMHLLHPDIILMCGGIDSGAVSSLLRMGEILQLADPSPKFGEKRHIPLIFAGNTSAQPYISGLFQERFDLYLVPNLRPSMTEENLTPAREKIHKLFMDNVMEQAPGYNYLKGLVADDIIPTPLGVIKALQLLSEKINQNIMSVDIGGATTDIFSNILGSYFRTVSANYGMSYSIANVFKDAGYEMISRWLPASLPEDYIRDYIANKMLYPTFVPESSYQIIIEQAIVREALRLSRKQHLEMNFKKRELGFLDKLAKNRQDLEKITQAFYFEQELDKKEFHMYDINLMIGAGGAISHAADPKQALVMVLDGLEPEGITEIWRDRHFISPHLGKLSSVQETLASRLLMESCYEKLGMILRPVSNRWKPDQPVMDIQMSSNGQQEDIRIMTGDFIYLNNGKKDERKIKIDLKKGFYLNSEHQQYEFHTDLPILVDARISPDFSSEQQVLNLFDTEEAIPSVEDTFRILLPDRLVRIGKQLLEIKLPYPGEILVEAGETVSPETVIGRNIYDPPRIYVLTLFDKTYLKLTPENLPSSLLIREGEEVKYGQHIVEVGSRRLLDEIQFQHFFYESPVRGRIEKINIESGTIILREIQDYSTRPVKVDVAKRLNIEPRLLPRYMKKITGDFVYAGEPLASRLFDGKHPRVVSAPGTGTIREINTVTGLVTIKYDKQPFEMKTGVSGIIKLVNQGISALVEYEGTQIQGRIGFGSISWGELSYIETATLKDIDAAGKILVVNGTVDLDFLKRAQQKKAGGVIASSLNNRQLVEFIGTEIGVALTGNEDIPFPIILTEGFGNFTMNGQYQQILQAHNGKWCYLNGHTQIRAGVVRPVIIIQE